MSQRKNGPVSEQDIQEFLERFLPSAELRSRQDHMEAYRSTFPNGIASFTQWYRATLRDNVQRRAFINIAVQDLNLSEDKKHAVSLIFAHLQFFKSHLRTPMTELEDWPASMDKVGSVLNSILAEARGMETSNYIMPRDGSLPLWQDLVYGLVDFCHGHVQTYLDARERLYAFYSKEA